MLVIAATVFTLADAAPALDRPWISDTYFYWYTWDYEKEIGSWIGGVYNTPLVGYYESRSYDDNYRELKMASEWGITHHFMDYWAPHWLDLDGKPREALLMRATEALRDKGYDIWMSYYQDGEDFQMDRFTKNMEPGRDVYLALKNYAGSRVWPRIQGKPFHLVYGRNGLPALSEDHEAFRGWLKKKYADIGKLNAAWQREFKAWEEVELDFGAGVPRADSICFQYDAWKEEWARLDAMVNKEFGYPGLSVSFDIGYAPFRGFGFSNQTKTFTGPHSYGGIFGPPEEQDVERLINAVVAKWYDTVFLDHFKNFYHDWEIRIPGIRYAPHPLHFDRFWTGAMMRYSEALLHLSWNEWWEGSNLEPCMEYGKTYCEKNMFYSTLMQLAFPSIKDYSKGAQVAVLLNDRQWTLGSPRQEDLYGAIQSLRSLTVPFALIPDDFVTAERLSGYKMVIAPSAGVGFGVNAQGEDIAKLLDDWVKGAEDRHLLISLHDALWRELGLKTAETAPGGEQKAGPDMNCFVDVGVEGDEKFLVNGFSGRENWGKLEKDKFGASDVDLTARWTPASGRETVLILPASPGRDHVLRICGNGFAANSADVLVNGRKAGRFEISGNRQEQFEVSVPAALIGNASLIEVKLAFEKANIPGRIDPKKFPGEGRVCNLGLDWLQFATAGTPLDRERRFTIPEEKVMLDEAIFQQIGKRELPVAYATHGNLSAANPQTLSRYATDGAAHMLEFTPSGSMLVVNGDIGRIPLPLMEFLLMRWAKLSPLHEIRGKNVRSAVLDAGTTRLVLAMNYDSSGPSAVNFAIDPEGLPVADVTTLSRDEDIFELVPYRIENGKVCFEDEIRYCAIYQIARCPVRLAVKALSLHQGEKASVDLHLQNLTDEPVNGRVTLRCISPTITSDTVEFSLPPQGREARPLTISVAPDSEWGRRTVSLEVEWPGGKANYIRKLVVERAPELRLTTPVITSRRPLVGIVSEPSAFAKTTEALDVKLKAGEEQAELGDMAAGREGLAPMKSIAPAGDVPVISTVPVSATYSMRTGVGKQDFNLRVARLPSTPEERPKDAPADAIARIYVVNGNRRPITGETLFLRLDEKTGAAAKADGVFMRETGGNAIPSQMGADGTLVFACEAPPESVQTCWICAGKPVQISALRHVAESLGTGKGKLTVDTGRIRVVLDEAKGATMTSLLSLRTGNDYGAAGFGCAAGDFSRHDDKVPTDDSVQFIKERKINQRDFTAKIAVIESGPARLVVECQSRGAEIATTQTYVFRPDAAGFDVSSTAHFLGKSRPQEVVILDARLKRNGITKIFPNFTGIIEGENEKHPHFGWREAPYLPPYATMMTPDAFNESVSFVMQFNDGADWFRQGLWPAQRPNPGICEYSQLEYIARARVNGKVSLRVILHPGHQVEARLASEDMRTRPIVIGDILPGQAVKIEPAQDAGAQPAWWNAHWRFRAQAVPVGEAVPGQWLSGEVDLSKLAGERIDPDSVRVVAHIQTKESPGRCAIIDALTVSGNPDNPASLVISWRVPPAPSLPSAPVYMLYFDTQDRPKPRRAILTCGPVSGSLVNGSFEMGSEAWALSNAAFSTEAAKSGRTALRLALSGQGISLAANGSMRLAPKSGYRLTFFARTSDPGVEVRTNFYQDSGYDFAQVPITLEGDGQWKKYEAALETRDFPPDVAPALRMWLLNQKGTVLIDDVTVEPLTETGDTKMQFTVNGKAEVVKE